MTKRRLSKSVIKDDTDDNYHNKYDNKVKMYSDKRTKKIKTSDETSGLMGQLESRTTIL